MRPGRLAEDHPPVHGIGVSHPDGYLVIRVVLLGSVAADVHINNLELLIDGVYQHDLRTSKDVHSFVERTDDTGDHE